MDDGAVTRDDVLAHVSSNLRRLRRASGLSQGELAEASGLSRRMIVSLERGDANISLTNLDKLADALGVNFVAMVADPSTSGSQLGIMAWRGARPDSVGALLASVPAAREAQLWSWSLDIGERYVADPDAAGWHEIIIVTAGCLRIQKEDGDVTVPAGGHVVYSSAQRYAYANAGEAIVRFFRVVVSR